ncbi:PHP domain-containing protein [Moorella sulfitireducens]|uniref:PHP domain-containing protein n=1 Tax=Neomoorella sulfitireducens TaxID=2972948 RepID=UPI0021AC3928|nr:PHP domain-containing protein [Moorella sulfitireducens]
MPQSFRADYHVHTSNSDGRAGAGDMVAAACRAGLEEVALTDHGPRNIGVGTSSAGVFLRLKRKVATWQSPGIRVLVGAEANVVGLKGEIDIPAAVYRQLDLLLVGLHPYVLPRDWPAARELVLANLLQERGRRWRERAIEANTRALMAALEKHPVFCVTHPGLGMPVDVESLARACARTGTFWEINVGHLYQHPRELAMAASYGVRFVVNSDAHQPATVGRLEEGWRLLRAAGVPLEQVINLRH